MKELPPLGKVEHWKSIADIGFSDAFRKALDVWLQNPDRLTALDHALRVVNPDAATTAAADRVEPDEAVYDLQSSVERDILLKQSVTRWAWVNFTLARYKNMVLEARLSELESKDASHDHGTPVLKVVYDGERTQTLSLKDGTPIEGGTIRLPLPLDRGVFKAGTQYAPP